MQRLKKWVINFCDLDKDFEGSSAFSFRDTFMGYSSSVTLSSLVFSVTKQFSLELDDAIFYQCQRRLIAVASAQGIVRALKSSQYKIYPESTSKICYSYFQDERHISLRSFLDNLQLESRSRQEVKYVITTFTSVTKADRVVRCLSESNEFIVERLSAFDTELELSNNLAKFYHKSDHQIMILQCDMIQDKDNLMLTKFIIDKENRAYQNANNIFSSYSVSSSACASSTIAEDIPQRKEKRIILLISLCPELYDTDEQQSGYQLIFSDDWCHNHIDNLEQDTKEWNDLREMLFKGKEVSLYEYVTMNSFLVQEVLRDSLITSFKYISYNSLEASNERIQNICNTINDRNNRIQRDLLQEKLLQHFYEFYPKEYSNFWIVTVACFRERLEFNSFSFIEALHAYVKTLLLNTLVKVVYLIEKYSAMDSFLILHEGDKLCSSSPNSGSGSCGELKVLYFRNFLLNDQQLNTLRLIEEESSRRASVSIAISPYQVPASVQDLKFPFFLLIQQQLRSCQESFISELKKGMDYESLKQYYITEVQDIVLNCLSANQIPSFEDCMKELYFSDVISLFAAEHMNSRKSLANEIEEAPDLQQVEVIIRRLLGVLEFDILNNKRNGAIMSTQYGLLHLCLWRYGALISDIISFLQIDSFSENCVGRMDIGDEDMILQVCSQYVINPKSLNSSQIKLNLVIYQLLLSFIQNSWNVNVGNESLLMRKPFRVNNCLKWKQCVQQKFIYFKKLCGYLNCNIFIMSSSKSFVFGENDDTARYLRIMLHCYGLGLWTMIEFMELAIVLLSSANLQHLNADQRKAVEECILNFFVSIEQLVLDDNFLKSIVKIAQALLVLFPLHANSISNFKYKCLKRYLLLLELFPLDEDEDLEELNLLEVEDDNATDSKPENKNRNGNMSVITFPKRSIYRVVANCIVHDVNNEVTTFVDNEVVSIMVRKLYEIIESILDNSEDPFESIFAPVSSVWSSIKDFGNLFTNFVDTPSEAGFMGKLEILLADHLFTMLKKYDAETLHTLFSDSIRKERYCDLLSEFINSNYRSLSLMNMGLIERVYSMVFVRLFLDFYVTMIKTESNAIDHYLNDVFGECHQASGNNAVWHVLRIYIMKSLQLTYTELKEVCQPEGRLALRVPWVSLYPWLDDNGTIITKLFPSKQQTDVSGDIDDAWQEMSYLSDDKMTAILQNNCDKKVPIFIGLINKAFGTISNGNRLGDSDDKILRRIEQIWLQNANTNMNDSYYLRVFHLVASRFQELQYFIEHEKFTLDDVLLLLMVTSVLLNTSDGFIASPFGTYIRHPESLANHFVLSAHSHELIQVFNAQGPERVTFYTCECGFQYSINNCGQPMESRQCQCGRMLGGQNHAWVAQPHQKIDRPPDDQVGYYFILELMQSKDCCTRSLSRVIYRILSLFVHICVLAGLLVRDDAFEFRTAVTTISRNDAIKMCWDRITLHWNILCELKNVAFNQKEELCAFLVELLHTVTRENTAMNRVVLQSTQQRDDYERYFATVCDGHLSNFDVVSNNAVRSLSNQDAVGKESILQKEISEKDKPSQLLPRYFRLIQFPSYKAVKNYFQALPQNDLIRYPVISAYFLFEESLHR